MTDPSAPMNHRKHNIENPTLVAFPLGGIGAGMLCLDGTGGLSHVSLKNRPDLRNAPLAFSAVTLRADDTNRTVLLEGPVPTEKRAALSLGAPLGATYGLPRLGASTFRHAFPVAWIDFAEEDAFPLRVSLTAWSPFTPPNADQSSLPVAAIEYHFVNTGDEPVDFVYSFNAKNFMGTGEGAAVRRMQGGFVLEQAATAEAPWEQGVFAAFVDDNNVRVNPAWYRGGHRFNPLTMLWNDFRRGQFEDKDELTDGHGPSVGGSLFVPVKLAPGDTRAIRLLLAWHAPESNIREGMDSDDRQSDEAATEHYRPWYAGQFESIRELGDYWRANCDDLREKTFNFSDCFQDSSLPEELLEAVSANLSILKSPTVLRQTDGRLWLWEGSSDRSGSCYGSCTHVWNYAQAICHLFPEMERSLRHTEFNESQDETGHQEYRSGLPIRSIKHVKLAPADGQLGGIMKIFRDWRIGGDTDWLRSLWPTVRKSLDYCIETWDTDRVGAIVEPHHNTYDIEFWGPDGMCCSFYLGALKAASMMGAELGQPVEVYNELYAKGRALMESDLFNGEYFIQKVRWRDLRSPGPEAAATLQNRTYDTPEARRLLADEGPVYQYGTGCLSDGVLGAWMAEMCGVGEILDPGKVLSHLLAVYRYNFREELTRHTNLQRPQYAIGKEGGLLLCSWPHGNRPSLPFIYSDEVWTGIEYQVAGHLACFREMEKAIEIVKTCRKRYAGDVRNPFDEVECGHWYGRALASYGLLQAMTGVRYDAMSRTLHIAPPFPGDFRSFLCAQNGYGTAGVKNGQPFLETVCGTIDVLRVDYSPWNKR